jgi:hypothetical protein
MDLNEKELRFFEEIQKLNAQIETLVSEYEYEDRVIALSAVALINEKQPEMASSSFAYHAANSEELVEIAELAITAFVEKTNNDKSVDDIFGDLGISLN